MMFGLFRDTRYCSVGQFSVSSAASFVGRAFNNLLCALLPEDNVSLSTQQVVLLDSSNENSNMDSIGEFVVAPFHGDAEAHIVACSVIENFVSMSTASRNIVIVASVVNLAMSVAHSLGSNAEVVCVFSSNSDYNLVRELSIRNYPWSQVVDLKGFDQDSSVLPPSLARTSSNTSNWRPAPNSSTINAAPGLFGPSTLLGLESTSFFENPPAPGLVTRPPPVATLDPARDGSDNTNILAGLYSRSPMGGLHTPLGDPSLGIEHEQKVDLCTYTIAIYFEKLRDWGGELFSEGPDNNILSDDSRCSVSINIDTAMASYFLIVRGRSSSAVNQRAQRFATLVEDTKATRASFQLVDWTVKHHEAIVGSDVLKHQEKSNGASAFFALNSGMIMVEIVALNQLQQQALWAFLKAIRPEEAVWKLHKSEAAQIHTGLIMRLRNAYACIVEVAPTDGGLLTDIITLTLYGFGPVLINQAIAHLPINNDASLCSGSSDMRTTNSGGIPDSFDKSTMNGVRNYPYAMASQSYSTASSLGRNRSPSYAASELTDPFSSPSVIDYANNVRAPLESRDVVGREIIRKIHRGTYSFADREAGIFFFAFEIQFRDYLEKVYSVIVEDSDFSVQYNKGAGNNGNNPYGVMDTDMMNSKVDLSNKNIVLKISFYGNSMKNVSAARSYLEQLNTTSLARIQLFFPQVSQKKYKEIYTRKATQSTCLNSIRIREIHERFPMDFNAAVIDPLQSKGFINIRIKPPMHNHGVRRMGLPADVTVTICGSVLCEENIQLMKELEDQFNSIPSDYIVAEVKIPYSHPMKRNLTIKALREELIAKYNLIALKWEEGSRATGSVGTAKIWASAQDSMNALLYEIKAAEAELEKAGLLGNVLTNNNSLPSQDCVPGASSDDTTIPGGLSESNQTTNLQLVELSNSLAKASLEGDKNGIKEIKTVVYLPDLTLRYVLLAPPLNKQLNEMLTLLASQNIKVKYPFRDRNDPHATLLLEGEQNIINVASSAINDLIAKSAKNLLSSYLVVSEDQYKILINNDLAGVKFIQGQAGVHVKLDPVHYEVNKSMSVFDMRLFYKPRSTAVSPVGSVSAKENVSCEEELLTVAIRNISDSSHALEASVLYPSAAFETYMMGVHAVIKFVVDDSMEEEVLITMNPHINKYIVSVSAACSPASNVDSTMGDIKTNCIIRRLRLAFQRCAEKNISVVAIWLPRDLYGDDNEDKFSCLVNGTVDAVMQTVSFPSSLSLQRLLFVECSQSYVSRILDNKTNGSSDSIASDAVGDESSSRRQVDNSASSINLDPADNLLVIKRLLKYVEDQFAAQRSNISDVPHRFKDQSLDSQVSFNMKILISNIPLPMGLLSFLLIPSYGPYSQSKYKSFLLKGLPQGVSMAVDLINTLFQQQQPQLFLAKSAAPATINTINTLGGTGSSVASTITSISTGSNPVSNQSTSLFNPNTASFVPTSLTVHTPPSTPNYSSTNSYSSWSSSQPHTTSVSIPMGSGALNNGYSHMHAPQVDLSLNVGSGYYSSSVHSGLMGGGMLSEQRSMGFARGVNRGGMGMDGFGGPSMDATSSYSNQPSGMMMDPYYRGMQGGMVGRDGYGGYPQNSYGQSSKPVGQHLQPPKDFHSMGRRY